MCFSIHISLSKVIAVPLTFPRHSGAGRNPDCRWNHWIPACAGMTEGYYWFSCL